MNIEVERIKKYLQENKYFRTIDDIDSFAKLLFDTYANRTDLMIELKKMNIWLESNPKRLKKNYKRFITNWLNKLGSYKYGYSY